MKTWFEFLILNILFEVCYSNIYLLEKKVYVRLKMTRSIKLRVVYSSGFVVYINLLNLMKVYLFIFDIKIYHRDNCI